MVLNDIKKNPKINDFNRLTQRKLHRFKQEIFELEKVAGEKYKELNSKKLKVRRKTLGKGKNSLKNNIPFWDIKYLFLCLQVRDLNQKYHLL